MLKHILTICLLLLFLPESASAQHVLYGERDLSKGEQSIHFDCEGFPYPDYRIPDSTLVQTEGSLYRWFQQYNEAFISICANYNYFPESIEERTITTLRDSILQRWIVKINRQAKAYPAVAFYIHGFRKEFVQKGNDVTSVAEFAMLKENLATYDHPKALEIEVYWDGMYDCCFSANRKRNKELFSMYKAADYYAYRVGINLRRVLTGIETQHLQLLAHSLGARVATSALFGKIDDIPTPSQETVSICLLVPAIDGPETFTTYYDRRSETDLKTRDNYRLLIVYNEEDFVLLKKDPKTGMFGPGPKKYGETTLGCNYKGEAVKLKQYFREHYPHSTIELLNRSDMGKCHSLRCYTKGGELSQVSDFLWDKN
jgi:hypothetical protein